MENNLLKINHKGVQEWANAVLTPNHTVVLAPNHAVLQGFNMPYVCTDIQNKL